MLGTHLVAIYVTWAASGGSGWSILPEMLGTHFVAIYATWASITNILVLPSGSADRILFIRLPAAAWKFSKVVPNICRTLLLVPVRDQVRHLSLRKQSHPSTIQTGTKDKNAAAKSDARVMPSAHEA